MSRSRRHVVLVTASRDWTDESVMRARLAKYPPGTLLIHGGALGGDMMANRIAPDLGFRTLEENYFEDLGTKGGNARNQLLVDLAVVYKRFGYTVTIEAFPTATSRGTWDCADKAHLAGILAG